MRSQYSVGVGLLAVVLVAGLLVTMYPGQSAAQKDAASGRYSVVATDGAHLITVDHGANKLYFYAIDRDGKIGDELKLRGTIDLKDVGKPSIKPIDAKPLK